MDSVYDIHGPDDPNWQKTKFTWAVKDTSRWFFETWKPKYKNLPVYKRVLDDDDVIYVIYGQVGNRIIEESIEWELLSRT